MNTKRALFSFLLLTIFLIGHIRGVEYLPVVLVHGLSSDPAALEPARDFIESNHPGTYVLNLRLSDGNWDIEEKLYSEKSMWRQLEALKSRIHKDVNLRDGFHMIGHSQGGLLARAYVQDHEGDDFKARRLITWGTPHAGEFGIPESRRLFDLSYEVYLAFYRTEFQKHVSFAQYWNDPLHQSEYLGKNTFLPFLNNEIVHGHNEQYKKNLSSLETFVLFRSTMDEVVEPVESCWFGFYQYSKFPLVLLPMDQRSVCDNLGLRALKERGALIFKVVDCDHTKYETDPVVLEETLKFLTIRDGTELDDCKIVGDTIADSGISVTPPPSDQPRKGCTLL